MRRRANASATGRPVATREHAEAYRRLFHPTKPLSKVNNALLAWLNWLFHQSIGALLNLDF